MRECRSPVTLMVSEAAMRSAPGTRSGPDAFNYHVFPIYSRGLENRWDTVRRLAENFVEVPDPIQDRDRDPARFATLPIRTFEI